MAFQEDRYLSSLKLAKVLKVFKSGLITVSGKYRPISLLSNINKIIEKLYILVYTTFLLSLIFLTLPSLDSERAI